MSATRIVCVLGDAGRKEDLGAEIVAGLHEAELRYLRREEWAMTTQDVLWRCSKLGLHPSMNEQLRWRFGWRKPGNSICNRQPSG